MSEEKIFNLLLKMNIPVAYDHFTNDDTVPPFLLYRNVEPNTFKADDLVYFKNNNYIIDLITEKKDLSSEKDLEGILNSNHIPFDKNEDFIESERIFQIRYFI